MLNLQSSMWLRRVAEQDCYLLWQWANDSSVRASAFQSHAITWDQHVAWFRMKMGDWKCYMYIFLCDSGEPVGQVRFEIQDDGSAEVSISVIKNKRRQGFGVAALRCAVGEIIQAVPITQIIARIKADNIASIKVFEKAGFRHQKKEIVNECEALCMTMSMNSAA